MSDDRTLQRAIRRRRCWRWGRAKGKAPSTAAAMTTKATRGTRRKMALEVQCEFRWLCTKSALPRRD